ncbi:transposase [Olsenella sp. Marseille-P4559]|uniref:transposase n=1 Tax=Olsenella sp. Marseille-P4559 TaxID=2364795 RepID=UPI0010321CB2|nr:transposase [Olsenella sp. Marseille-P4559]
MPYAGVDVAKADRATGAVDEHGEELGRPMSFKNFLEWGCAKVERPIREPLIPTIPASPTSWAQAASGVGDVSRFGGTLPREVRGTRLLGGQSGKFDSGGGPITKHGSPYLRRALWLAANGTRQYDPGLKAFYDKKGSERTPHRVAVTAVARKLCHIVFAIMRD